LQANTLAVDNLTVYWLRTRLNELESSVKECQEKQNKLISVENGNGIGSISTPSTPILNGTNSVNGGKESIK